MHTHTLTHEHAHQHITNGKRTRHNHIHTHALQHRHKTAQQHGHRAQVLHSYNGRQSDGTYLPRDEQVATAQHDILIFGSHDHHHGLPLLTFGAVE